MFNKQLCMNRFRAIVAMIVLTALVACSNPPPTPTPTITAVTVSAASSTLDAGASTALSATVTGANGFSDAVNWSIVSGTGTLSNTTGAKVTFTALSLNTASTTVIRATSVQDSSKSGTVTINAAALPVGATVTGVTATATPTSLIAGG